MSLRFKGIVLVKIKNEKSLDEAENLKCEFKKIFVTFPMRKREKLFYST